MAKQYYRVDGRDIATGDEVLAQGNYQSDFDDIGNRAEAILEDVRATEFPAKPTRAASMFITDDLACAESYWRTHDKRYLYEVDIAEDAINHQGDMNWVDTIGSELKKAVLTEPDNAKCKQFARKYWNGTMSNNPCPEFLVDKVTVRQRLKGLSDLKAYIAPQVTRYDGKGEESIEELIDPDAHQYDR